MSEERDLHLGRTIKNSDYHDHKEQILKKAKAAPYSQPIQRLADKLGSDNKLPLLKYAWLEKSDVSNTLENSVMTVSTVTIKGVSDEATVKHTSTMSAATPQMSSHIGNSEKTYVPDYEIEVSEFTQWLNNKTKPIDGQDPDKIVKLKSEEFASDKAISAAESATIKPAKRSKSKSKKKSGKSKLQKKIDASLQDHKNLASEPLARLYNEQGFYKKSLKMYEQLSLINPEKSSFFAPFIEELKNKLK